MTVALIDYGAGNLRSVHNALRAAGAANDVVTADADAVPPRGDLRIAWLLNFLSIQSETLAFDLAIDGSFARRIGPGRRYRFRQFGGKEFIVSYDAATFGGEWRERNMKAYSRLYLRQMPGGKEYYAVALSYLIKERHSPPAPNPDGKYVPGLMDQRRNPPER